jgi:uncharacterized pyridoxal phosphate-dependent enzyme
MNRVSRRELFRIAGLAGTGSVLTSTLASAAASSSAAAEAASALGQAAGAKAAGSAAKAAATAPHAPDMYAALGVKPLINCRGTLTVIGGSTELPEVRAVKDRANQQYVAIDELMHAIGGRLAELTGAEWGMVSAGCAAAMSLATAACVAGGNPDLHVRIPNLTGFEKDEVIIPTHSRNVYDQAVRNVGVKILEVDSIEALQLAIGPKTAMIYFFATGQNESGPMSLEAISAAAKVHNVPVLVDAAAEVLTIPNIHLQRGATLVAYSGGKIIRGPQSAGLLLGRKDLIQAAWVHSAPHHGYSRSMKIGREEMVGMLVAVESWVARDHDAEWKQWVGRCEFIADRVSKIAGVTATVVRDSPGRSNRSPRLTIRWDSKTLGITGAEVSDQLYAGEPRIALAGGGGGGGGQGTGGGQGQPVAGDTGIAISASMMATGDEKIVAERVYQILSAKHTLKPVEPPKPPAANLSGTWTIEIQYAASKTTHTVYLQQNGNRVEGTHQGNYVARDIAGTIDGDAVTLASNVSERHGDALSYRFKGTVSGETLSGTVDLGEYLAATWTARRATRASRQA